MQPNRIPACNFLLAICLALLSIQATALEMSIIPLNNAQAEHLLPIIQNQLGPDSSASSYQNQIILDASAAETAQIKNLIALLDVAGKQLLISVKNGSNSSSRSSEGSISNNGQDISISKNGRLTKTTTTLQQRSTENAGTGQQSIRATEGYPSFISTGTAIAYQQPVMDTNGNITQSQEWQTAESGFYATARVNGRHVSITIEQQKQDFNSDTSMNSQQLDTKISGNLGEWIALGNIDNEDTGNSRSLNSIKRTQGKQSNTLYLKVELAE